jgi:hypothetical protein
MIPLVLREKLQSGLGSGMVIGNFLVLRGSMHVIV